MKILVDGKEIKEDSLEDLFITADKGIIKTTGSGSTIGNGRKEEVPKLTRELAALDSLVVGESRAAELHDVPQPSIHAYVEGKHTNAGEVVDQELKDKVNIAKHDIKNAAVGKLMATLDLFNPNALENQMEVVSAASKLAGIVEKMEDKNNKNESKVELHLYAPRMNKVESYEVIEVG